MKTMPKVFVAIVTPFNEDKSIDYLSCEKIIEHLIKNNVGGIVVSGTTGECSTLSFEEKIALLQFVIKVVNKRIQVWMGCGTNDTSTTIQLTVAASKEEIDGIMVITPYYNKPSQEGLYQHFKAVSESTEYPVMLYNVPKRTGINLNSDTAIRLANSCVNIHALKQATSNLRETEEIINGSNLTLLSGDDGLFLEALEIGVDGIVSVVGHLFTPLLYQVIESYELGLDNTCDEVLKRITKACFMISSPCEIKYLMSKLNLCKEYVRLPLVELSDDEKMQLDCLIHRIQQNSTNE